MEDIFYCLLVGEGVLKFVKKIGFFVVEDLLVFVIVELYERLVDVVNYVGIVEDFIFGNLKRIDSIGSL